MPDHMIRRQLLRVQFCEGTPLKSEVKKTFGGLNAFLMWSLFCVECSPHLKGFLCHCDKCISLN